MNNLIITRHGRTKWNLERRIQGNLDSPLLSESIYHLKNLGKKISEDFYIDKYIISSKKRVIKSTF